MHNLVHLADDITYMKCPLSNITAFPFENALGKIKKLLRSGNKPIAQICRRLHEIFFAQSKTPTVAFCKNIEELLCRCIRKSYYKASTIQRRYYYFKITE